MESKHTPTPWKVWDHPVPAGEIHIGATGTPLIAKVMLRDASINEFEANAAFIVRACNTHEELLFAAEFALKQIKKLATGDIVAAVIELEKAIAKARRDKQP